MSGLSLTFHLYCQIAGIKNLILSCHKQNLFCLTCKQKWWFSGLIPRPLQHWKHGSGLGTRLVIFMLTIDRDLQCCQWSCRVKCQYELKIIHAKSMTYYIAFTRQQLHVLKCQSLPKSASGWVVYLLAWGGAASPLNRFYSTKLWPHQGAEDCHKQPSASPFAGLLLFV